MGLSHTSTAAISFALLIMWAAAERSRMGELAQFGAKFELLLAESL